MPRSAAAVLLLLVTFSSHAALVPGPEHPVAPVAYGPSLGHDFLLNAVASDGRDFLVLWSEVWGRTGLFATIVDEDGGTRPIPPLRIPSSPVYAPHAVWTGDAYLVLWHDGSSATAARLSRDAELLSEPVKVPNGRNGIHALAWSGDRGLAIFSAQHLALLDASGRVIRADIALPHSAPVMTARTIGVPGGFVVVWTELDSAASTITLRAARVSSEGDSSAPVTLADTVASYVELAALATDGESVGVAFEDHPWERRLRRFTLDASTLAVTAHPPLRLNGTPHVLATPRGLAVAVVEPGARTWMLAVHPFGRASYAVDAGLIPFHDLGMYANGRAVLSLWGYSNIFATVFNASLTRRTRDAVPVAISAAGQDKPALGVADDGVLVTWVELTAGRYWGDRLAVKLDRAGRPSGAPLVLARDVQIFTRPAVAFTGEVWLVAWQSPEAQPRMLVRRLRRDGTPIDAEAVDLGFGAEPALASNGRVTVLAMNGGSVVRFGRDGRPLDAEPILLASKVTPRTTAAIATNGNEFLVAWRQGSEAGPNRLGVYGTRLDASGWPMDAASFVIADTPRSETEPQIASDGRDFLVVYHLPSEEVRAKRVLRNGTLADATGVQDGELVGTGARADVARFGERYLVVLAASWPLARAVVVDERGVPVTDTAVDLITGPTDHVLAESDSEVWIAYSRADDGAAADGVPRVFVRPLFESSRRRSVRN